MLPFSSLRWTRLLLLLLLLLLLFWPFFILLLFQTCHLNPPSVFRSSFPFSVQLCQARCWYLPFPISVSPFTVLPLFEEATWRIGISFVSGMCVCVWEREREREREREKERNEWCMFSAATCIALTIIKLPTAAGPIHLLLNRMKLIFQHWTNKLNKCNFRMTLCRCQ